MFSVSRHYSSKTTARLFLKALRAVRTSTPPSYAARACCSGRASLFVMDSAVNDQPSSQPICIRRIEEADLERGFFDVLSQLTDAPPLSPEKFGRLLRVQRELDIQLTLVAVQGEKVLGTGSVLVEPKFIRGARPAGHIEDVVTDASLRGKGVGKQIIERLVEYAKEKGCYKVILDCSHHNVEFYEKCGLKQMGRQMGKYF